MNRILRRVASDNLRGMDLKTENECIEIARTRLAEHNARCALRGESTDGNRAVVYMKLPLYTSKSGSSQSCAQAAVRQLNEGEMVDASRCYVLHEVKIVGPNDIYHLTPQSSGTTACLDGGVLHHAPHVPGNANQKGTALFVIDVAEPLPDDAVARTNDNLYITQGDVFHMITHMPDAALRATYIDDGGLSEGGKGGGGGRERWRERGRRGGQRRRGRNGGRSAPQEA
jgi:hypothetical protein